LTVRLHEHGFYYADTARVIGRVEVGAGVSFWYGAAVRGDVAQVTIGDGSNVQDNATIHCDTGRPNRIGAGVFVGSNSTLVAPLAIGDGAFVAAGSTITRNLEADALALGRARQTVKEGYARKLRERLEERDEAPGREGDP